MEYGNTKGVTNPHLVLESAWRNPPNWQMMKDALGQVETAIPKEMAWKINLYRGYLAICHPDDPHLATVDRYVEVASALCIKVTLSMLTCSSLVETEPRQEGLREKINYFPRRDKSRLTMCTNDLQNVRNSLPK